MNDDISNFESRQDRYGKTEKKTLTLTSETIDAIEVYAQRHKLYFSVAIETLARMGLGQTTAETLPRLVANLLERTVSRQFNRFAKLLVQTLMASEETNYKTNILLLQTVWSEARRDPNKFVENLQISDDGQVQPDALTRQLLAEMCTDAQEAALTRLKKPLGKDGALWPQEDTDEV